MTEDNLMNLSVRNAAGQMVPLSSIASLHWTTGPMVLTRYNGYPSLDVSGRAANGYSSGAAMAEMERLAQALPVGVGYDWIDAAREETACRAPHAATDRLVAAGRVHGAGRALRKLDHSVCGADGRAARA